MQRAAQRELQVTLTRSCTNSPAPTTCCDMDALGQEAEHPLGQGEIYQVSPVPSEGEGFCTAPCEADDMSERALLGNWGSHSTAPREKAGCHPQTSSQLPPDCVHLLRRARSDPGERSSWGQQEYLHTVEPLQLGVRGELQNTDGHGVQGEQNTDGHGVQGEQNTDGHGVQGELLEQEKPDSEDVQGKLLEQEKPDSEDVQGELLEQEKPDSEDVQGELLDHMPGLRLSAVLASRGFSRLDLHHHGLPHAGTEQCVPSRLRLTDTRYPPTLPTEESPRRRARSLPENAIPEEAREEDEGAAVLCCCKLKKRVQFADSLGLTLASVKLFLSTEEPTVPPAVLARLQSYPPSAGEQRAEREPQEPLPCALVPEELLARLASRGLCLEQASSSSWGVRGSVLVQGPTEGVQVKIRYTFNDWLSFLDCPASRQSAAGTSHPGVQRFLFSLCYPPSTPRIQFAICCISGGGQEVWDNNQGSNYTVSCQQEALPDFQAADPELETWGGPQHW
ncbi:phosphatase 1 regulatory subunit 3G [Pelobates cultripes]|uniref:Phosphatase 1 regulatory subunit 3G n=1 Tax=Pelobates cultripes TaxID=61616 RepID=A0AAD1RZF5_PELCU|nr:phosphatase 1 regulatory subunit 3G [Pelobates cultripes]